MAEENREGQSQQGEGRDDGPKRPQKPRPLRAAEYLIKLDRRHEAELRAMRESLKRKYTEHAAEVLRKLGLRRAIPESADNPALAACGILIAEFPPKAMHHVLSELPTDIRDAILEQLLNMDALFRLDSRSIQKLLREIPQDVLAVALQGVDEKRLSRVFENLSSGGADVLRDEIDYAAGTDEREIAAARRRIGEIMRDRYVAGEVPLPGAPGGAH